MKDAFKQTIANCNKRIEMFPEWLFMTKKIIIFGIFEKNLTILPLQSLTARGDGRPCLKLRKSKPSSLPQRPIDKLGGLVFSGKNASSKDLAGVCLFFMS